MKLDTRLAHAGRPAAGPVSPPVMRASTILFEDMASYDLASTDRVSRLRYGVYGTETLFQLEKALTSLEQCFRAIVVPSGLAAVTASLGAVVSPGGHLLVADSVYGPPRSFCDGPLVKGGVEVEYFDPMTGSELQHLVRSNTQAIVCESPGSMTFEVMDIPALVKVGQGNGVPLILDNTWATPVFFDAMGHGVDISIQAATKYLNGHSDILMGVIATSEKWWSPVRERVADFGFSTSPDDCYLALRGRRTLTLRLRHQQASCLNVASWLQKQPGVREVVYPALPGDRGYSLWQRDFTGASSVFGVAFDIDNKQAVERFINGLRLFGIGASWGGFESLVLPARYTRRCAPANRRDMTVRLHVGLEDPDDLKEDLALGLKALLAA
ncbi:cystathionine beta-lyase [Bradyrhizobium sp. USDA 4524]|uniref:cystathionine beta-lyase n=1 Tax=unclassified Bradyrhizobium TaxID=2631580 RepID=UPI00209E41B1|nr:MULTISPECIES: cystathionine beta-lyase [unclassified Bradyrhizobium]MCP1845894.1 cystathionine beta-lyase [Bradyrhizobium sp. USDA 4538]MCP1907472.1 cystathionine beta-lyase [Bradyrhizobium sp. USDA 4537]MCP1985258.1 cystathionine beta-lyase [Bradyrhizobium sp. USDA 4539]